MILIGLCKCHPLHLIQGYFFIFRKIAFNYDSYETDNEISYHLMDISGSEVIHSMGNLISYESFDV